MLTNHPIYRQRHAALQRGISLIEALVSLVVLALGVMGLAGVQARMLTESRTANYRSTAIGLIDDLTNRMLLNRDTALSNGYALAWGSTKNAQDCVATTCTGAQLAKSDLNLWRLTLVAALPGADATVFQSGTDSRQVGIAVAWSANEGKAANSGDATSQNNFAAPFSITNNNSGVACPATSICHVIYVQP